MLSLHLVLGFPRLLLPSTMPSKQSLDTPVVDLLMCPYNFRVLHFIFSKRGGSEVLLRRVVILILSINQCPRMRRIMWFWNTSMRWETFGSMWCSQDRIIRLGGCIIDTFLFWLKLERVLTWGQYCFSQKLPTPGRYGVLWQLPGHLRKIICGLGRQILKFV